jgi:hypothetical protein
MPDVTYVIVHPDGGWAYKVKRRLGALLDYGRASSSTGPYDRGNDESARELNSRNSKGDAGGARRLGNHCG